MKVETLRSKMGELRETKADREVVKELAGFLDYGQNADSYPTEPVITWAQSQYAHAAIASLYSKGLDYSLDNLDDLVRITEEDNPVISRSVYLFICNVLRTLDLAMNSPGNYYWPADCNVPMC